MLTRISGVTLVSWGRLTGASNKRKMSEVGMMVKNPKVFLSHSAKDEAIVRRVAAELRSMQFEVWLYEENISAGSSIPRQLDQALGEADYVLLFWSQNS